MKEYLREYKNLEDMLGTYSTLSAVTIVTGLDCDIIERVDDSGKTIEENIHFELDEVTHSDSLLYTTEEIDSGGTPMIMLKKDIYNSFFSSTPISVLKAKNYYITVENDDPILSSFLYADICKSVAPEFEYHEITEEGQTHIIPTILRVGDISYNYVSSGNTFYWENGDDMILLWHSVDSSGGQFYYLKKDDYSYFRNVSFRATNIRNIENGVDNNYYYEPWVSLTSGITEEVVTALVDTNEKIYRYDKRLIGYDRTNKVVYHRWIRENDGKYFYSKFRAPIHSSQLKDEKQYSDMPDYMS